MPKGRTGESGTAMVEFALVAPFLFLLLFGVMVMGIVINSKIVVAGAAREGSRVWAIYKDDRKALERVIDSIQGGGLAIDGARFDPAKDVTIQQKGQFIEVTVTYRQPTYVPLLEKLDRNSPSGYITLQGQAIFRVEG